MTLQVTDRSAAGALFAGGDLPGAIAAAGEAVRREPERAAPRLLLAELLLFDGAFSRADAVLDAAAAAEPAASLVLAEFRQLIRAAIFRSQVLEEGRLPEFLPLPTQSQQALLRALVSAREGDLAAAASAATDAEAMRPAAPGRLLDADDWRDISDFRDACDVWGGTLEALTVTGRYFWIPVERVLSIQFHPTARPRDLVWRRCTMEIAEGPEGDVYVPALYHTSTKTDPALRLGRATEWTGDAPVRGVGQRTFLAGETGVPIQALGEVRFG